MAVQDIPRDPRGTASGGAGAPRLGVGPVVRAAAAALGLTSTAVALLAGAAGLMVYEFVRPRGIWGSDEPAQGQAEEVTFRSAVDGTRLCGWFLPASKVGPAPTVLMAHGLYTGRREGLWLASLLQEEGFNALCFDFRAHGQSGGAWTSIGYHEADDVLGALAYLRDRPEVDARRIGLLGWSMGAVACLLAAARSPEVAAVVADSAYTTFSEVYHHSFTRVGGLPRYPFAPLGLRLGSVMLRVPIHQMNPVEQVVNLSPRPLLLIHGAEDDLVPPDHAHRLFEAAGQPKELWMVPGAGHAGARDVQPREYQDRVVDFFRQNLRDPRSRPQVSAA